MELDLAACFRKLHSGHMKATSPSCISEPPVQAAGGSPRHPMEQIRWQQEWSIQEWTICLLRFRRHMLAK